MPTAWWTGSDLLATLRKRHLGTTTKPARRRERACTLLPARLSRKRYSAGDTPSKSRRQMKAKKDLGGCISQASSLRKLRRPKCYLAITESTLRRWLPTSPAAPVSTIAQSRCSNGPGDGDRKSVV